VDRISEALNDLGKAVRGSRILAVGAAYKPGVGDLRESPAVAVMEGLARRGAVVSFHDPFVERLSFDGRRLDRQPLTEEVLAAQDCVALLTVHPGTDVRAIVRGSRLVFDTRGSTLGVDAPNVIRL
jgi:UDP-N-acetyl-D-glucosamine dehydrogenase